MPGLELSPIHLQEDGAREEGPIACYVRIVNSLGPNAAILVSFHAKETGLSALVVLKMVYTIINSNFPCKFVF